MTIQAHPEFDKDFNRQLLQARKTTVIPEGPADRAIEILSDPNTHTDSSRFGEQIAQFFIAHQRTA